MHTIYGKICPFKIKLDICRILNVTTREQVCLARSRMNSGHTKADEQPQAGTIHMETIVFGIRRMLFHWFL